MNLGEGVYSRVVCDENNPDYAIKEMDYDDFRCAVKELVILKSLDHANVVRLEKIQFDEKLRCRMWMKRYPGSLGDSLKRITTHPLDMRDLLKIIVGLASGINHIHNHHVIHCDVKPDNVLLSHDRTPLFCDFNIARVNLGRVYFDGTVQTKRYRAPEVKFGKDRTKYSEAIDIWSIGCILYEIMTGRYIIENDDSDDTTIPVSRWMFGNSFDSRKTRMRAIKSAQHHQMVAILERHLAGAPPFYQRVIVHDRYKRVISSHLVDIVAGCLLPDSARRYNSSKLLNAALDLVAACSEVGVPVPLVRDIRDTRSLRTAMHKHRKKMRSDLNITAPEEVELLYGCDIITQHFASAVGNHLTHVYSLRSVSPTRIRADHHTDYVPPPLTPRNVRVACAFIACCLFDENISQRVKKYVSDRDLVWLVARVLHDVKYRILDHCPKIAT